MSDQGIEVACANTGSWDVVMGLNKELDGLLVVSLEQAVAAPYCGLMLADAGARVIKVERPEGDFARKYDGSIAGHSAIFGWLNRGKESICLDLRDDDDKAVMMAMLAKADVFLSNLATGAVERMGFGAEDLRKLNPKLITCQISGYGAEGPMAEKKAYDFLVQGESGVCAVTGSPGQPARVGVSLTDLSSGLTAFSAILRALIQVGRTGQGLNLNVSMFDVMADWMNMPLLMHRHMGGAPPRSGLQHSFVAPYGAYQCAGGAQALLSIQNNREWVAFCHQVLKRPDLAEHTDYKDNKDRHANREKLDALINDTFSSQPLEAVIAQLDDAKIANSTLNSVAQLSDHVLLREATVEIGNAEIQVAALPVPTDGESPAHVPTADEHGVALRSEFG